MVTKFTCKNVSSRLFKVGLALEQNLSDFQNNGLEFKLTNHIFYN